ncbi:hypothetical protein SBA2_70019 [Acidobacteriia bacterium SbA2]|nr:hypothetical protein SBA2_70019 [Acidobacteriia bacterium SbA2]
MNAARRPTAYAVGYFLAPLRGSRSPHIFRLTLMCGRPGNHNGCPYGIVVSGTMVEGGRKDD